MDINSKIDIGAVKIHKNVIASIASIAAKEIDGVKEVKRLSVFSSLLYFLNVKDFKNPIHVELGKNDEINIEIPLIVKYGYCITDIAEHVQENVRNAVEKMLEKTPREINVNIQGIEKT